MVSLSLVLLFLVSFHGLSLAVREYQVSPGTGCGVGTEIK